MKNCFIAAALALTLGSAHAADFEVNAKGSVLLSAGNPQTVRAMSLAQAKQNAVIAGINRINGPDSARDPKVAEKIQAIADQISDDRLTNRKTQALGDQYETSLTLMMDDKEFRTLLSDQGIAVNTATARSFSILAVMDEFFTTPTDLKAPLEELEEFSHKKGNSFKDKSINANASKQASASKSSNASMVDARASSSGKASGSYDSKLEAEGRSDVAGSARDGYGGAAAVAGSSSGSISARDKGEFSAEGKQAASYKEANASSQSAASASSNSAISAKNVASETHDDVHYKKLIKYQPQNRGPEKTSLTYNALKGQMQDYDLKVLDNDLFRSKYFKNKPITIEQMQKSEELAKYVAFAKTDAKADFFMVGSSIIIDSGKNAATGESVCTGVMTVKTYSVVSGEDIASETTSETAAGANANDCAAAVSKKLATTGGAVISARVQDYWKRRNAYGREYVLTLRGLELKDKTTRGFMKAVKAVGGVEKTTLRSQTDSEYQLVVVYKGESFKVDLDEQLDANSSFENISSRVDNDQILICMESCGPAAPAKGKGKK